MNAFIESIQKVQPESIEMFDTRVRVATENMLKIHQEENYDIVVLHGCFRQIYYLGELENLGQLRFLIHFVPLMGYALIFRKGVPREVFVAFFPVEFSEGMLVDRIHVCNRDDTDDCYNYLNEYVTYLSGSNFQPYKEQMDGYFFLDVPLDPTEVEICSQLVREYRWKMRRAALLVARRIWNGWHFHTLKYIAEYC